MRKIAGLASVLFLFIFSGLAQSKVAKSSASGGPLSPFQAVYDVQKYDITVTVEPEDKKIKGNVFVEAKFIQPADRLDLDLDSNYSIKHIQEVSGIRVPTQQNEELNYIRIGGKIQVFFDRTRQVGELCTIQVVYEGRPKIAPRPPWIGGFVWSTAPNGQPWVATACQNDGADMWFPCKDHPSDEADAVRIAINVPNPLVAASNGVLVDTKKLRNQTTTYVWETKNPINNYNIALNIGPYEKVSSSFKSIGGEEVPMEFYVLPEHKEKAEALLPEMKEHLAFYEKYLGPYPFRNEKYGVAETPHMGMEHQTIIAYGYGFKKNEYGYDFIHHHELGHEWWGNLVTAADWKDFWIHEGFCSYMQALYNEEKLGKDKYHHYFMRPRWGLKNVQALAPREPKLAREIYFRPPYYTASNNDIYSKGALFLHTLRYVLGDEVFFKSLRKMAYPSEEMEQKLDGSQCRFVSTDDYLNLVEELSGQELGWLFEMYLRQPQLPNLMVNHDGEELHLEWDVPEGYTFPMPLVVSQAGKTWTVEMKAGKATLPMKSLDGLKLDPEHWILMKSTWEEKLALRKRLEAIEGLTYTEMRARDHFKQAYALKLEQPLNHQKPKKGKFEQYIYLSHANGSKPTLMETCGYEAHDYTKELAKLTEGNQLIVEYRFYGKSKPETVPWTYLTNDQAVEDYHRIRNLFGSIYKGKWMSSGISKGGETTLIYKSKYPDDVAVAVPYVAPIILSREDPRTTEHINTIGEKWCRDRVFDFQRLVLERRANMLALAEEHAKKKSMTFSVGLDVALEYAALEYPFSFWQWGGNCEGIPDTGSSDAEVFAHLDRVVGMSFYCDKTIEKLYPSYYQHMRELGYYGFDTSNVSDLLQVVKEPTNAFFAPPNQDITYNPDYMPAVLKRLQEQGNNILYIYGEYDTWGACGVEPGDKTNALKMVLRGGSHATRMANFSIEDQEKMYATLRTWLGEPIYPLFSKI